MAFLLLIAILPAPAQGDPESDSEPDVPGQASLSLPATALLQGLRHDRDYWPSDRHRTELSILEGGPRPDYGARPRVAPPEEVAPAFVLKLSGDEREVIHESERWKSRQFTLLPSPALLDGTLLGRGELASVEVDGSGPAFALVDQTSRLLSLGVEGEWNGFGYGAGYRAVGKKLEKLTRLPSAKRDEDGGEAWVERRFSSGRVRLSFSEFSDNVDRDPRRARIRKVQAGLTTSVTPPSWPTFSLTYRQGSTEREEAGGASPTRAVPVRSSLESILGSILYGDTAWDIALSSTYSISTENLRPWRRTFTLSQDVSGSYRPTSAITLTSRVGRGEDWYDGHEVRNHTTSASISLTCAPLFSVFHLTAVGSYVRTGSTDGYVDGTTTTATASVARSLGKWQWGNGAVSLEVGYSGYRDAVYPEASYREVFGLLRVRVASF